MVASDVRASRKQGLLGDARSVRPKSVEPRSRDHAVALLLHEQPCVEGGSAGRQAGKQLPRTKPPVWLFGCPRDLRTSYMPYGHGEGLVDSPCPKKRPGKRPYSTNPFRSVLGEEWGEEWGNSGGTMAAIIPQRRRIAVVSGGAHHGA